MAIGGISPAEDLLGRRVGSSPRNPLPAALSWRDRERPITGDLTDAGERDQEGFGAQLAVNQGSAVLVAGQVCMLNAQRRIGDDQGGKRRGKLFCRL